MLIYFAEITLAHIRCYYYEYRSYILIILMRVYSLKISKSGISCTQIYYVISWKRYFHGNSILRNRATSHDVRRIRITIWIRVLVLQKVRIWVMVEFFLKALVSCICLHFPSMEMSIVLEKFLTANDLPITWRKIPLKDMQFSNLTAPCNL